MLIILPNRHERKCHKHQIAKQECARSIIIIFNYDLFIEKCFVVTERSMTQPQKVSH